MSNVKFELSGLDEFEKTLINTIQVKYPAELEKKLLEIGDKLYEKAVKRTPIGPDKKAKSKRLKNKWKLGKVRKKNGDYFIELKNTAPHAHLVEDGHRLVTEDGRVIGFVEGKKMLQISVKEIEEELTPELQRWLNEMLKELSL